MLDDGPWPANAEMSLRRRILGSRLRGRTDQRDRKRLALGRSIRRLDPKAARPSIAALVRAGERKASEMVRRIQRAVLPWRAASDSMVRSGLVISSSSQ